MMLAIRTVINSVGVWPTDNKRIMKDFWGVQEMYFLIGVLVALICIFVKAYQTIY